MFYGEAIRDVIGRYFNLFTVLFVVLLAGGFWLVHRQGRRAAAGAGDTADGGNE